MVTNSASQEVMQVPCYASERFPSCPRLRHKLLVANLLIAIVKRHQNYISSVKVVNGKGIGTRTPIPHNMFGIYRSIYPCCSLGNALYPIYMYNVLSSFV